MNFLEKNKPAQAQVSERQQLADKFARSRHNLLLVVAFSVINIILLVTNSNSYFLWSAYIPYLLADLGMTLSGSYPPELYTGEFAGMDFMGKGFLAVMLVIAGVILLLYLLCWIFSKKNKTGWLIFALVLFGLDTVLMLLLNGIAMEMIIDIVFHVWVIVVLFMGISAGNKLKALPPEPVEIPVVEEAAAEEPRAEE